MNNQSFSYLFGKANAALEELKVDLPGSITINTSNYGTMVLNIVQILFAFIAVMAFVGVIYSGIMMITSGGDASKFETGKKNLMWSIVGVIVVALSYFIIKFVVSLTGGILS